MVVVGVGYGGGVLEAGAGKADFAKAGVVGGGWGVQVGDAGGAAGAGGSGGHGWLWVGWRMCCLFVCLLVGWMWM